MKVIIVGSGHDKEYAMKVVERLEELKCDVVVMDDIPPPMTASRVIESIKEISCIMPARAAFFEKPKSKYHK